ncbi:HNH endonuclease [Burkholderia cepacia]|uniref:HNH endonuclease n=1 Tax=Burkholderia cepacia TaxID=292 RepID=UPI001FC87ADB|nr:HNH endonuclease signature motif containing protein [Burkholderia cepacia]
MSARVQLRTRGSKWMKIRARILRRDPICVLCTQQDVVRESVVVDHIKPLEHGGTDADDNLRGLCADHHDQVTRQQFGHRERRKAFGPDGLPLDGSWS